jgi:transcriptional regulator with XRE-family HTH domain
MNTHETTPENENTEIISAQEIIFLKNRKNKIRQKLKAHGLTQENLAAILGHKSKTHMSELMNGVKPFTLRDLVIISRLLRINITELVPAFLSAEERERIRMVISQLSQKN